MDDIIIASQSKTTTNDIINRLNEKFNITDLGKVKCYLGVMINRSETGEFLINQKN